MAISLSLFAGAGAQFFDNSGVMLSGGLIYTYAAGTTTPEATYADNTGATALPNPIVLNSSGRIPTGQLWITYGVAYKFVVKTSTNTLIGTYDNIPSAALPPLVNDAASIAYEQGAEVTAGSFIVGKMYLITSIGNTNFQLIGASANTVGIYFVATGAGTGTGTAQVSRTVQAKLRESVSVMDFGAVGDGTTDDSPAFNAAIASLSSQGGTITYPAGYIFAVNLLILKNGVKIQGSSGVGSITAPTTNYLKPFDTALPVIQIGNDSKMVTGITLSDIQLYGANTGTTGIYWAGGASYSGYDNVAVSNFSAYCIRFKSGVAYPCVYIKGVNVSISPFASGCIGYSIDNNVVFPGYTTAIYLTNFNISSPNTSGHAIELIAAEGLFSQGYVQVGNLTGIKCTLSAKLKGSNVTVDTNVNTNVTLETDDTSSELTNIAQGSVTFVGKWRNGLAVDYTAEGTSYNFNDGQFNNPIVTGLINFPDTAVAGYASDNSASIFGSSTATTRILNIKGTQIRLATPLGGTIAVLAGTAFYPFNNGTGTLGQANNRWSAVYTSAVLVAALPSATTGGAGARAFVSDATATTFASIVAGGGANNVPVYSNGTNWLIG
jgi:hypothetical protein